MEWQSVYASKLISAQEAVSKIKRGSRVFIGTGCGEPQHLLKAMVSDQSLQDIMLYQMLSYTLSHFVENDSFLKRFSLKLFFISRSMRKAAFEGKIDYIPAYLSRNPAACFPSNGSGWTWRSCRSARRTSSATAAWGFRWTSRGRAWTTPGW